jgi:hypothetical protein
MDENCLSTTPLFINRSVTTTNVRTPFGNIVQGLTYKPGWTFSLENESNIVFRDPNNNLGLYMLLRVGVRTIDSDTHEERYIPHTFLVPHLIECFDEESQMLWLLDVILKIERHETKEFFKINGERVFPPGHGPDQDLYG